MKPINIDDKLHRELKLQSVIKGQPMFILMNRYVQLGLWYDSLDNGTKAEIDSEIEKFLIDKEK